jgi:phosphate starvation-inducible PhoH-like protein
MNPPAPSPEPVHSITIPLRSNDEAILVLGPYDRNAKLLRQNFALELYARSGNLRLEGEQSQVTEAAARIEHLLGKHRKGRTLDARAIEEILLGEGAAEARSAPAVRSYSSRSTGGGSHDERRSNDDRRGGDAYRRSYGGVGGGDRNGGERMNLGALRVRAIEARTQNQRIYLEAVERNSLTFGIGSAGSGKTYLAAAAGVRALRSGSVRRLIVTRPVVEAGERLGFLPGDLAAKLNPYVRPVYDALFELVSFEEVQRLEDAGVIEIAPLAYMRGRTLSHAFVILDEAQNTTPEQMKMFLTRLGEGSRMVVTGDPTQSDLDPRQRSGLMDAVRRLRGFADIAVVEFGPRDIVRHPLVERIVHAYDAPPPRNDGAAPRNDEERNT